MARSQQSLHFRSDDGRFGLSLSEGVAEDLLKFCGEAGNVETGGILIGCYSSDQTTAVVQRVTRPPPDSKHYFARFLRGVQGLQELLDRAWSNRHRRFYLGEWHYHPSSNPDPSGQDAAQMQEIARSERYACPEPVLLIVAGRCSQCWSFSATVYRRDEPAATVLKATAQ